MGRWTINPIQFVRNVGDAMRQGTSLRDRLSYLSWFYHDKGFVRRNPSGKRYLNLRVPSPVEQVRLALRDNGADQLVYGEVLITRDYDVEVPTPKTVLDLGGNIGLATLFFSRRWPTAQLAVVEPVPANLAILRENLSLNRVNATVFPAAVADHDGEVEIALNTLDCAHKIIGLPGAVATKGTIRVEALSIPTIMARLNWDRIGFLKMDIEGYEATLLKNRADWLDRVDALCVEAFDNTISDQEMRAIAAQHRFKVEMPKRDFYVWTRA